MKAGLSWLLSVSCGVCCFLSCDFGDGRLQFFNNSQHTVSVSTTVHPSGHIMNRLEFNLENPITAGETKTFNKPSGCKRNGWLLEIRESKDKKLKVYVFNQDTLKKYKNKYSINQIVQHKLIDTVFVYTEKDLKDIHWKISFK